MAPMMWVLHTRDMCGFFFGVSRKGVKVRHVSASKTRTAVVTDQGDMYVWEAVKRDTAHRHNTTSAAEVRTARHACSCNACLMCAIP